MHAVLAYIFFDFLLALSSCQNVMKLAEIGICCIIAHQNQQSTAFVSPGTCRLQTSASHPPSFTSLYFSFPCLYRCPIHDLSFLVERCLFRWTSGSTSVTEMKGSSCAGDFQTWEIIVMADGNLFQHVKTSLDVGPFSWLPRCPLYDHSVGFWVFLSNLSAFVSISLYWTTGGCLIPSQYQSLCFQQHTER